MLHVAELDIGFVSLVSVSCPMRRTRNNSQLYYVRPSISVLFAIGRPKADADMRRLFGTLTRVGRSAKLS
jgi:hypothetical protein